MQSDLHQSLHPAVAEWFGSAFEAPTSVQGSAWAAVAEGSHTLIAAPTGSGKTLAAFLQAINGLVKDSRSEPLGKGTRVLYVSPLKALSNDIHRNLDEPLAGIERCLFERGEQAADITAAVRTGDTPQSEREKMRRKPPHILVTTPESLYILLSSDSGRQMLASVATVIVDEIHALAGSKRGAHLSLSLVRLDGICARPPIRIGLSATQKPIETVARFLCGEQAVRIVDTGYTRERDLQLAVTASPLTPVMANEVWTEIYDQLEKLIGDHHTTLIFVNTRRHAERVARHLSERIGEEAVTAHHGSLAKEHRLDAEQRLKSGRLRALVATASLELGIDIGDVDLVCQLGSPRSIAGFLQRVGRSGHAVNATPKGRLFPLSRDDLVECTALLDAVRRGELDRIVMPCKPLDVLAQQIVAEVASRDWAESELFEAFRSCWSYRNLSRDSFTRVVVMLAEGFSTRRGRRSAYLHRDVVNGSLRARAGARLVALTNGGTIPDQFDYQVVLRPQDFRVGTVNEDFAFESIPGDIFQLGNISYRILKIETGRVYVEDARGQPPNIPFWFGEAPGRSDELSRAVSRLRQEVADRLSDGVSEVVRWLDSEIGVPEIAASQLVDYLAKAKAALGLLPTHDKVVLERFFDETGDMHLVVHSTYGSRINRALGLALRKKFCRRFNFELQAAALEDSLVLSLGATHSFDLGEVMNWVKRETLEDTLTQAVIQAPMFPVRWRWVASIALAVRRMMGGDRRPPQFQRSDAEDLVAVVFPDQIACQDNVSGPRVIPDHPLVDQALHDCLNEVMDIGGLDRLLASITEEQVQVVCCDLVHPSPLAEEILNARPYSFLDDGAAEERRTNAVRTRSDLSFEEAASLRTLDPEAISRVRDEAWVDARNADELHDALMISGFVTDAEVIIEDDRPGNQIHWKNTLGELSLEGRAVHIATTDGGCWVARERLHEALALWPDQPEGLPPPLGETSDPDSALLELLRSRMEVLGPVTEQALLQQCGLDATVVSVTLLAMEGEGVAMRVQLDDREHWCNRRLLARIHGYTLKRRRGGFRPVDAACYLRFLQNWHGADRPEREGRSALEEILGSLEGWTAPARAWEQELLPQRMARYWPEWLDELCASGRFAWFRRDSAGRRVVVSATPITLVPRSAVGLWLAAEKQGDRDTLGTAAARVLEHLQTGGALFFEDLYTHIGGLEVALEEALAELVAAGEITSDGFHGIRHLTRNAKSRNRQDRYRRRGIPVPTLLDAGRWSLLHRPGEDQIDYWQRVEHIARVLIRRWGVVIRATLAMETGLPPWRDLLYVFRRLEARDEIAGGRFVDGFSGEQFAAKQAADTLAGFRDQHSSTLLVVAASDPLNLTGVLVPGDRVAATVGNRVAWQDGVPIAARIAGEVVSLDAKEVPWSLHQQLIRDPGNQLPKLSSARGSGNRP